MKLNFETIKNITIGASRVEKNGEKTEFFRFTKEQEELYKSYDENFYMKTFATSGIKFMFETDSKNLYLNVSVSPGSSREYFSFDVFVDGKPCSYLDNFERDTLPENYTTAKLSFGEHEKTFDIGEGVKQVCIHFPWSMKTALNELSVDDGAFINPIKPSKKLLAFGDSITHGYDALRPSNRYIARLADALDAEEYNKAIGGEKFFPPLSKLREKFEPDYISVAYGTNDWKHKTKEEFTKNCTEFYKNLSDNYPTSQIFAITPIWRSDSSENLGFGKFLEVEETIIKATASLKNVTVISGYDLVSENKNLFADFYLHPNDEGFKLYAKNLIDKIKKI